jgi:hypothetical protein
LRVDRLEARHDLAAIGCGVKALDDFSRAYVLDNRARNLSRTFALVDDGGQVIGYYSLTMGGVGTHDLPPRYGCGLTRYEIGMVLLARLAVAQGNQGSGLEETFSWKPSGERLQLASMPRRIYSRRSDRRKCSLLLPRFPTG